MKLNQPTPVVLANAGTQKVCGALDSRLRGNDGDIKLNLMIQEMV